MPPRVPGAVVTLSEAGVYAPHPQGGALFRFLVSFRVHKQWGPLPQRWRAWRQSFQHRSGTARGMTNPYCVDFCSDRRGLDEPVCDTTRRWRLFGALQDPLVATVLIYDSDLPKAKRPSCWSKPTHYILPDGNVREVTSSAAEGAGAGAGARRAGQSKQ
jgi:hypothetical protein